MILSSLTDEKPAIVRDTLVMWQKKGENDPSALQLGLFWLMFSNLYRKVV